MKLIIRLLIVLSIPISCLGQDPAKVIPMAIGMGGSSCALSCCNTQTPLGIMTDHVHPKGKWIVSYTYMNMMMHGDMKGTRKAGDDAVYENYMMAPQSMTMQMNMLMVMYSITDRFTLMAMGSYINDYMTMSIAPNMVMMPGMVMPANTNNGMQSASLGFGDTKLYGLYSIMDQKNQRLIGSLGVSIPTGSTKVSGVTMLGDDERLSYPMQLGTGSYSLLPSLTYVRQHNFFSWGAAASADIKLDKNNEGYKWGNTYNATAWASYGVFSFMSASLRAEGIYAGKISGSDPAIAIPLNVESDPTADPNNTGGTWVNIYAGINFHVNKPILKNFHLQLEYGIPVYQDLNGTQMALRANLLAGINYMF